MGAPKGNQYYKFRKRDGRKKIFKHPDQMAELWNEYIEDWPNRKIVQQVSHPKNGVQEIEHIKPLSITEFSLFGGFTDETFNQYSKENDFSGICTHIRNACREQNVSGAMAGVYNANLAARLHQIKEQKEIEEKSTQTIKIQEISSDEIKRINEALEDDV